jgi:exodeoxyribonuclease VII small subunit
MTSHLPLSFEQSLEQLQQTVKKLESGELSLEDSLKAFEEGVRTTQSSLELLRSAEQKVEQLLKVNSEGQAELKPFGQ